MARRLSLRPVVALLIVLNLAWLVLLLCGTDASAAAWACGAVLAVTFLAVPWISGLEGEESGGGTGTGTGPGVHLWVAGVTAIALAIVATDGEKATVTLVYPAIVAVWISPGPRARIGWTAALTALGVGLWLGLGADAQETLSLFGGAVAVAMNLVLRASVLRAREAAVAQRELVSASRSLERKRLLQEVHDVVGQELTLIALEAEQALVAAPGADGAGGAETDPHSRAIRSLSDRTRTLLSRMESDLLSLRGTSLEQEIRRAEEACRMRGVFFVLDSDRAFGAGAGAAPCRIDQVLACVLRESVANVIRHAPAARTFRFAVRHGPGRVSLTAVNDGVPGPEPGPGPGQTGPGPGVAEGMGLAGLRDRLADAGGALSARVKDDGVFELSGHIPLTGTLHKEAS